MISRAQIALVQTAKSQLAQLGVDDDTFRDIMEQETGVRSSKLIPSNEALTKFRRRLEQIGFEYTSTAPRKRSPSDPVTKAQKWAIDNNYKLMGPDYLDDDRRRGFNQKAQPADRGPLPWGQPQSVIDAQRIIQAQKAVLKRSERKGSTTR